MAIQRQGGESARRLRVIDPDEVSEHAPDGVYVLVERTEHGDAIELWELAGGTHVLAAYTSVTLLRSSCGTGQPFCFVDAEAVRSVCGRAGAERLVLDEALPVGQRYPEREVADIADLEPVDELPEPEVLYLPSRPAQAGDHTCPPGPPRPVTSTSVWSSSRTGGV